MDNNIGVIVIGGHVQGLGVTRILGKNGIPVVVLDTTSINLARHSKYCNKFFKYKDLISKLIELGKSAMYNKWLLMPTGDSQVKILSQNKEILEKYFTVSSDTWEHIKIFYNKIYTYKLAEKLGIDYPRTYFPKSIDELNKINISYPCIIKPAVVQKFYQKAKKKVFVCENFDNLVSNYKKALSIIPKNEIIIQEIIPGTSENQYSACFLFNSDKPLVQLVARRKRQHPIDFGNATTFAETVENPPILKQAEKLLKAVSYKGVCEVEFKFDEKDKKYKLLEVNPRTWKWHSISEKSKSPFLISLYKMLVYGKEIEPVLSWGKAAFKHILTDIPTILKLKIKGLYIKSNAANIQYAVWDIKDIKPALFELIYLLYFILKR